MFKAPSDTVSDRGTFFQITGGFTSRSWTSRNWSNGHTTSTRSSECSARNGSMCFASSTRRIARCHSTTGQRLRGKILSVLWEAIVRRTIRNVQMQVRQLEQEADARFSQRPRGLSSIFSQETNQYLEDQREF